MTPEALTKLIRDHADVGLAFMAAIEAGQEFAETVDPTCEPTPADRVLAYAAGATCGRLYQRIEEVTGKPLGEREQHDLRQPGSK